MVISRNTALPDGQLMGGAIGSKGNTTFNPKLFMDGKILIRRCEGLVLHNPMSDEVRFAHFTVFEYLEHHRIENILKPIALSKVSLGISLRRRTFS